MKLKVKNNSGTGFIRYLLCSQYLTGFEGENVLLALQDVEMNFTSSVCLGFAFLLRLCQFPPVSVRRKLRLFDAKLF